MPATTARLIGSKDGTNRARKTKSAADKKKDAEAKSQKKASEDATQRERNGAHFRTSLFHHNNPPSIATPPHPEPTAVDHDAVELRGIPCWTEQVDPEEITAELDYNLEEEDGQEYNDADADTLDAPETSVINIYLRAIQARLNTRRSKTQKMKRCGLRKY